ncbi:uncharacterized protein KRP23_815 [Phytophthora ramorum]|uniref:Mitochondrial import inner membrane translocase subunit TIM22 n=1 Tax=Phytophthora ramorum TaxID=164328 RepID=H3GFW2_PHYRM|nr:hypothetical protein KRP23_815 [Phytophthora ramorum]
MAHRRRATAVTHQALRVGSVGTLVPLLTVTAVSSFADRREALNAPSESSDSSSADCVSTTAQQVFRGLGAGLAWTIGVDGYELARTTDAQWKQLLSTRPDSSIAREAARTLGRNCGLNMLGFASFLGIYGGVSCSLEKVRGQSDLLNPLAGGFTAALIIMSAEMRGLKLVKAALLCGSGSMALHYFVSTGGTKKDSESE